MPTTHCVRCRKQLGAHFEFMRRAQDGSMISSVSLCSLICSAHYVYEQAVMAGFKLALGAQGMIAQVKTWLKGSG
jgi:hypothetical protein